MKEEKAAFRRCKMDQYIEKSEPSPFVELERYRLTLHHEMFSGGKTIQLDSPINMTYTLSPFEIPYDKSDVLAKMIKEFENQLIFLLGERYKDAAHS